jgi:pilus assembly protein CpaF
VAVNVLEGLECSRSGRWDRRTALASLTDNRSSLQGTGPEPAAPALRAVSAEPDPPANGHSSLLRQLQGTLGAWLARDGPERPGEAELRQEAHRLADEYARDGHAPLDFHEQERLVEQALDELVGYGPIADLMRDGDVSEILVNGPRQLFVERRGQLEPAGVVFRDEAHLEQTIHRIVGMTGRHIDRRTPMVDARLPDGSRINAVLNPPALNGPLVSIRRFGSRPLTVDDLLGFESLSQEMLTFLSACVKARISMIIAGGTGSGKTTLLNALSRYIPAAERLVTIEDTAELELQQPHVAKLEAQPPDINGEGGVTMADLVRNALRMRPDRIIVGECRGAEALDMLQAMNSGHEGSMTTIHANSPRDTMARIELMIGLAGIELPIWAIRKLLVASVSLVVQIARVAGGKRKVTSIAEVTGLEGDVVSMQEIFTFTQTGVNAGGEAEGYFRAMGLRPNFLNKLSVRGAPLPIELFADRRLTPQRDRGTAR